MVAVSVKLAGTTTVVLRQETRPPATGGTCRAHRVIQCSSSLHRLFHPNTSWTQNWSSIQTPAELRTGAPSKHQLSSELELHPNTSWAQNWSSIQTPAELRTGAPSKHQLSSELKLHPNTSWAQNWSSIQTQVGFRTEAPSKHRLGSELKLHPNTGWVQNWSSIQTQVGFRTEAITLNECPQGTQFNTLSSYTQFCIPALPSTSPRFYHLICWILVSLSGFSVCWVVYF